MPDTEKVIPGNTQGIFYKAARDLYGALDLLLRYIAIPPGGGPEFWEADLGRGAYLRAKITKARWAVLDLMDDHPGPEDKSCEIGKAVDDYMPGPDPQDRCEGACGQPKAIIDDSDEEVAEAAN